MGLVEYATFKNARTTLFWSRVGHAMFSGTTQGLHVIGLGPYPIMGSLLPACTCIVHPLQCCPQEPHKSFHEERKPSHVVSEQWCSFFFIISICLYNHWGAMFKNSLAMRSKIGSPPQEECIFIGFFILFPVIALLNWWAMFVGPTLDSWTKAPDAKIPLLQTKSKVMTIEHNSFSWITLWC